MPSLISSGGHVLKFEGFPSRFGTSSNSEILVQSGLGIAEHQFTIQREGSRIVLVAHGDHVTKVNGGVVRRTIIADGDIIDAGDLQLTYRDPNAVAFDANIPTWPTSKEWGKNDSFSAPFELEPIPSMGLAHTPTPVGQQPAFTPNNPGQTPSTEIPVAVHSTNIHPKPAVERQQLQTSAHVEAQPDQSLPIRPLQPKPLEPQSSQPEPTIATPPESPATVEPEAFDWSAATEEEESAPADSDELAKVFWEDPEEDKEPELTVPPVIEDLDLPSIPDIAQAEESGTAVTSSETHSKTINPIASKTMRRPSVPRAKREISTLSPISTPLAEPDSEPENRSSKGTKRRRGWRKKKSLGERMLDVKGQPKCKRLIPWHKVAVLVVILFAAAGAWLATEGQDIAAQIMHRLGLQAEADHKQYLEHFVTTDPVMLLTLDADAWVSFYRECATDLNSLTVTELNSIIAQTTKAFNIDDIDRLTLAVDRKGQILALVSVKEALNKRRLLYDLSRGMSIPEKLPNNITLHTGFVGHSARAQRVQFALLNEKTFAIGEATALQHFLSSDDTPLALAGQNKQLLELARRSTDSLGLYIKPTAVLALKSKAPASLHPIIDRISKNMVFPSDFEFLAQINSFVSFSGSCMFDSPEEAKAFAGLVPEFIDQQFGHIGSFLGSETATTDSMRRDIAKMDSTTNENRVQFGLKVPNRWLGTELQHLQETVKRIAAEMKSSKRDKADYTQQPDLLSPEDAKLRRLAKTLANEYATAILKEAPQLQGLRDINEVVEKLARGVRGGDVYSELTFRVREITDRSTINGVAELLDWKEGQLEFTPYKANRSSVANTDAEDADNR